MGEKAASDAAPVVTGRNEQLLDHDRVLGSAAKGDEAGRPALFAGDEDDVAPQDLERATVTSTGQTTERAVRKPK